MKMASEQQFCLRWNNHQSTLVAVFDTLLESGTLVDCTLAAEGQYLKAHKVVLSACSPYFELLLSQHNEKHPIVILKDVKFQELKAMMDYMYRGEVNISQDQLGALLKAAESLQIKGLSDSGGGNERESSDRRHSRKEAPAPQPPPARSPPSTHSSSSGLTIEHRRSAQQAAPPVVELPEDSPPSGSTPHIGGSREGSVSPIPRKRKRHRRRSSTEDGTQGLLPMTDSHDQTSSSCELPPQSQPAPATNIPAIISPVVPAPSTISRAASDPISSVKPDEQTDTELRRASLPPSQPNLPPVEGLPPDPEPMQKLEPMSEVLLEPKSEYLDDTMNEDSVENLTTLDDVDDMDDARPGPSHGGEGSSNQGSGFAPWHVRAADRTTDEVFMAAQEVVGAQRDSQGVYYILITSEDGKTPELAELETVETSEEVQSLKISTVDASTTDAKTDTSTIETTTIKITEFNDEDDELVAVSSGDEQAAPDSPCEKISPSKSQETKKAGKKGGQPPKSEHFRALVAKHKLLRKAGFSGQLPCELCGRRFVDSASLRQHVATHTGESRKYACDICGLRFSHQSSLAPHRRRHTGERPFQCDLCGLAFTTSGSMGRHKRLRHPEAEPQPPAKRKRGRPSLVKLEFPFECDVCHMRFKNRGAFISHSGVHIGDAPFSCDFCGLCFTKRGSLYRHLRNKHPEEAKDILAKVQNRTLAKSTEGAGEAEEEDETRVDSPDPVKVEEIPEEEVEEAPAEEKSEDNTISCGLCGMCFSTRGSMYRHMRKKHPYGDEGPEISEDTLAAVDKVLGVE